MPPVTDGSQVMRFGGVEVTVGSTLGTVARGFGWIGEGVEATLGTYGASVWIGGEVGIISGRDVCWRKMELSWSSWWR
jgi:hypothetical protein